jgi:YD repeat-containing protein
MKTQSILLTFVLMYAAVKAVTGAEFITYNYDSAGRLKSANHGSGKTTTYQYDVTGNLLQGADIIVTDSDNDGMADAWETTHFQTEARDGTDDFDGDGLSDVAEYLAGTLPKDPDSLLRMNRNVTNTVVQTTVSWSSISGKSYCVQYKNSLADAGWNDLPGIVVASGTNSFKIDTTSTGQPWRFYRVQALP